MEHWKLVDLDSLSPIFALSITAQEWGLGDLPYNVIGVEGTWPYLSGPPSPSREQQQNDSFIEVWQYYPEDTSLFINATSITPCIGSGQPLPDTFRATCSWILEDIGRNTTTTTGSDITGLACGLSFLISLLLTALIMGCIVSKPHETETTPEDAESNNNSSSNTNNPLGLAIDQSYNPPAPAVIPPKNVVRRGPPISDMEKGFMETNATRDICRCTKLLRELYSLDLELWGMEGCVVDDGDGGDVGTARAEGERQGTIEKRAEAIFEEVRVIAEGFHRGGGVQWTEEERAYVDEIFRIVEEQRGARRKKSPRVGG